MAKLTSKPKTGLGGYRRFSSTVLIIIIIGFVGYIGYRLIASYAATEPPSSLSSLNYNTITGSDGYVGPAYCFSFSADDGAAGFFTDCLQQQSGNHYLVRFGQNFTSSGSSGKFETQSNWIDTSSTGYKTIIHVSCAGDGNAFVGIGPINVPSGASYEGQEYRISNGVWQIRYTALNSGSHNCTNTNNNQWFNVKAVAVNTSPPAMPGPAPSQPPPNNPPPSNPPQSNPSGGDQNSGGDTSSATEPTASDQGPSAPDNFTANSNVVGVILNWSTSSGGSGALTYTIDRSTDQSNWTNVANGLSGSIYADTSTDFSTTYYYRIQALDDQNVGSPYTQTQITTQDFSSNVSSGGSSLTSDDGAVTANIPSGAIDSSASCAIVSQTPSTKSSKNSPVIVLGPYSLTCRTSDDSSLTSFSKPITFSAKVSSSTAKKYHSFDAVSLSGSTWKPVKGSKYSSKDTTVTFALSSAVTFAIAGSSGTSIGTYILIFIFVIVIGAGGYLLFKRKDSIVEWFYQH